MYIGKHICIHVDINVCRQYIYECIHLGMYKARHTYICMYMYACTWVYICKHACIHVYHVCSHVNVHIFNAPKQIWLPHFKYDCTAIMLHEHKENIFQHVCKNTSNCNIHLTCYCHVWASKKYTCQYATYRLAHVHIWHNYVRINASYELNAINNVTKSTAIHVSCYCHIPLNKYACQIAYTHPTALL